MAYRCTSSAVYASGCCMSGSNPIVVTCNRKNNGNGYMQCFASARFPRTLLGHGRVLGLLGSHHSCCMLHDWHGINCCQKAAVIQALSCMSMAIPCMRVSWNQRNCFGYLTAADIGRWLTCRFRLCKAMLIRIKSSPVSAVSSKRSSKALTQLEAGVEL